MPRPRRVLPRILLTGFEPFGGDVENPAMQRLPGFERARIRGQRVVTAMRTVGFSDALSALAPLPDQLLLPPEAARAHVGDRRDVGGPICRYEDLGR